jgi:hypothetical protein
MDSDPPKQRPDRWPLLVGVLIALGYYAVRTVGRFDWERMNAGDHGPVAEAVGGALGAIMLGLIGVAIYRETLGRKKPPAPD